MLLLVVILSHCKETTKKRVLQRIFPTSRGNFPIHHFVLITVCSWWCGNGGTVLWWWDTDWVTTERSPEPPDSQSKYSGLPVLVHRTLFYDTLIQKIYVYNKVRMGVMPPLFCHIILFKGCFLPLQDIYKNSTSIIFQHFKQFLW